MNDFDQAARFVAEMDPQGTVDRLLDGTGLRLRFRRWFPTATIPRLRSPEREADNVAELDDPWLLAIELQSRPQEEKLVVLLEEAALLASRARRGEGRYLVLPAMVHLTGEADPALLDMRTPSGHGLLHRPILWDIGKDGAAQELERIAAGGRSWSLLAWLPLMDGAAEDIIVARWREVLDAVVQDEGMRIAVRRVALTMSELARNRPVWDRGLKEDGIMGESQVFNELRRHWAAEERVATLRKCLLDSVDARFPGQMPAEVRRLIGQLDSPQLLDAWFQAALRAGTYGEFDALMRQ